MKKISILFIGLFFLNACTTPPKLTQPESVRIAINPHPNYQLKTLSISAKKDAKNKSNMFQEIENKLVIEK